MNNKKQGLFGKYNIQKANGKPIDDNAEYFVLRYDAFGDHCHVEASRKALKEYAKVIKPHIPKLAEDLKTLITNLEDND